MRSSRDILTSMNRNSYLSADRLFDESKIEYIETSSKFKLMIPIPQEKTPTYKCNKNPISPQLFLTEKRPTITNSPRFVDYGSPKTDRMTELLKMIDSKEISSPIKKKVTSFKTMNTKKFDQDKSMVSGKSKKVKEDKFDDFIQYFDTKSAEEHFLNEGMGLLTLHANRDCFVKHPTSFKLKEFKLPVSNLSKH
jgi:hypothetical protein